MTKDEFRHKSDIVWEMRLDAWFLNGIPAPTQCLRPPQHLFARFSYHFYIKAMRIPPSRQRAARLYLQPYQNVDNGRAGHAEGSRSLQESCQLLTPTLMLCNFHIIFPMLVHKTNKHWHV